MQVLQESLLLRGLAVRQGLLGVGGGKGGRGGGLGPGESSGRSHMAKH